jgi:septal ring factor EnvC (AmiA/AmiB activator)
MFLKLLCEISSIITSNFSGNSYNHNILFSSLFPAEMSLRVQAAEVEATYPEPEDAHALKIAELEATTSTVREGVDHLTAQLQALEVQRTAVKEHLQQLADKEKDLEKLIDTVEPRIRCAFDCI